MQHTTTVPPPAGPADGLSSTVREGATERNGKLTVLAPILMVTIGAGWLLTELGVGPGIDWVWTLGLALAGAAAFLVSGVDKSTIVIGPLFFLASGLSVLRQSGRLAFDIELPILVIACGLLLFVARCARIPSPSWAATLSDPERTDSSL